MVMVSSETVHVRNVFGAKIVNAFFLCVFSSPEPLGSLVSL